MSYPTYILVAVALPLHVLWGREAHAACADTSTIPQLEAELERAELAYSSFDIEAFRGSLDSASEILPCIAVIIPPQTAAHYHRMQGLLASVVRDQPRARQAFLAARSIDPGYRFPTEMLSEDHPVRLDYAALTLDGVVWVDMPRPREGELLADGQRTEEFPTTRPAIIQRTDALSRVAETTYLWPGETYDYETRPADRERSPGPALLAVAGGVGVSAAVFTALAAGASQSYWSDDALADYDQQRRRTNTLNTLAITTGATAGAIGVGALLVWDW